MVPGLALMGCGGVRAGAEDEHEVRGQPGSTVLTGQALLDGSGSILEALRGKVPGLRIRDDVGPCPRVTLRNEATYQTLVNMLVYVDGARASDTCILESLRSRDTERVEVYPTGVTPRPGYDMHAHGLILVFLRP